jgi:uncharacterized delta-60 repeat protein
MYHIGDKWLAALLASAISGALSAQAVFNPTVNSEVSRVIEQPDGKILICGRFTRVNDIPREGFARLNCDGTLDPSFDPRLGPQQDSGVLAIALQPDGKIVIGGWFDQVSGTTRQRLARLNADGSLDSTFTPPSGAINWVSSIVLQQDGKIVVGGHFWILNGNYINNVARLNHDGSLDSTFNSGSGANDRLSCVALQPDGRVVIGGAFTEFNGVTRNGIARLNTDGSLDTGFDPGSGAADGPPVASPSLGNAIVQSAIVQADGRILVGGQFSKMDGVARDGIARLLPNGELDSTFHSGLAPVLMGLNNVLGYWALVNAMALLPDGKLVVGGKFTVLNEELYGFARLNTDGSADPTFDSSPGVGAVKCTLRLQNGKILLSGGSLRVNNVSHRGIARVLVNGTLDMGPPIVDDVFPNVVRQGDTVKISGLVLDYVQSVTIDGHQAIIHANSATEIVVTVSPSQPAGQDLVLTVRTLGGVSNAASVSVEAAPPPVVTAVTPRRAISGDTITIVGDELNNTMSVHIGDEAVTILFNSPTELVVALSGSHPPGSDQTVSVTTPGGTDSSATVTVLARPKTIKPTGCAAGTTSLPLALLTATLLALAAITHRRRKAPRANANVKSRRGP